MIKITTKEQLKRFVQERVFKTATVFTSIDIEQKGTTSIMNEVKALIKKGCHIIIMEEK